MDMGLKMLRGALLASLALFAVALPASAQVVTRLPVFVDNAAGATDLGNGPLETKLLSGNATIGTSQGSGTGSTSGSSTSLTLTAVPTTAPCVGCIISGTGITSGTTVAAYNGVTSITLSAAMTVASGTAVAWGAACPSTPPAPSAQLRVGDALGDMPWYTQARICAYGQNGPGALVMPFAIGAH